MPVLAWLWSHLRWSSLSAFGNSPLAKLVAFAPIVAVFVKLQDNFLKQNFLLEQAEWLYWSLMSIALGQVLYWIFCPAVIKKYGSDAERHTIEGISSMPNPELRSWRGRWVKFLYSTGGLNLSLQGDADDLRQKILETLHADGGTYSPSQIETYANAYRRFRDFLYSGHDDDNGVEYSVLRELGRIKPTLIYGCGTGRTRFSASDFQTIAIDAINSNLPDWKVNVLGWRYKVLNGSRRPLVLLIAALYTGGSVYFGWRVLDGALYMLKHT